MCANMHAHTDLCNVGVSPCLDFRKAVDDDFGVAWPGRQVAGNRQGDIVDAHFVSRITLRQVFPLRQVSTLVQRVAALYEKRGLPAGNAGTGAS